MDRPATSPVVLLKSYLPSLVATIEEKARLKDSEEQFYCRQIKNALEYMRRPELAQRYSAVVPLLERVQERILMSASGPTAIAEAAASAQAVMSELEALPPVE
jgi:hypothetical protein